MFTCVCSLAGTKACENCSAFLMYYDTSLPKIEYKPYEWYTYWTDILKPFDSDRYELVEKKDWKIKQLKEEIAYYKMRLKEEDALRVQSYERESKLRLEHVKALDELKELETNKE